MDMEYGEKTAELQKSKRGEVIAEQACVHVLFAALGALLGSAELLFGVHPFGIALAAAAGKLFPSVALGAGIFAVVTKDFISLGALLLVAFFRLACSLLSGRLGGGERVSLFSERLGFRLLAATVPTFVAGVVQSVRGEFRYYHLFALVLGTLSAGLACLLLSGLFWERDRLFPYSRECGLGTLILLSIFSLRTVSFVGIYPAAVAAALVAFWLSSYRGPVYGSVGGLLAGFCFEPLLAPAFLLCGLGFGLLERSSRGGGILAGCGAGTLYVFAVQGAEGITRLLPALLVAGALLLAGDSAGMIDGSPQRQLVMQRRRRALLAARAMERDGQEKQIREISAALGDISGVLYELGNKQKRPGVLDLRHLCDREFDRVCPNCRHREICWGSEYNQTAEAVGAMATRLHATGGVDRSRIPPVLAARCRDLPEILEGITAGAERLFEEALRGDKTSVVAGDYAALSRMLAEMANGSEEAYAVDSATGERISARLLRLGYSVDGVSVCGKIHRQILLQGIRLPGRHIKTRELREVLEGICHFPLGEARVTQSEGVQDIHFAERAALQSVTVRKTRAKTPRDGYCGDSVMAFSAAHGYDYAFLCDGMGSGNAAALCSALCSTLLSRFLRAGNRADTSLRTLNGVMAARGRRENEASSTVDLLEIDRVSGEAAFFKCGAAPSYLLRDGKLTRFTSHTAPIGILEGLDAEKLSFTVEPGDVILQVSDGITKGEEECPWLSELLLTRYDGDAEKFARTVLARAAEEGEDDLSVMITEIERAPLPGAESERSA